MNQPSMNHANVHFLPDDENENNEVQQSVVKNADEVKKNKKKDIRNASTSSFDRTPWFTNRG